MDSATVLTPEFSLFNLLAGLAGLFWTACYILIIRKGFRDKICCMPIEALALNFVWEFLFGFIWHPTGMDYYQMWINRVWCVFDVLIVVTFFLYGSIRGAPKWQFRAYGAVVIAATFAIFGALYYKASATPEGIVRLHQITAFGVNVPMSMLFIRMLWIRGGPVGQSMGIAWLKFLGTSVVTIGFSLPAVGANALFGVHYPVILTAGWTCFVLDLAYIILLSWAIRSAKSEVTE